MKSVWMSFHLENVYISHLARPSPRILWVTSIGFGIFHLHDCFLIESPILRMSFFIHQIANYVCKIPLQEYNLTWLTAFLINWLHWIPRFDTSLFSTAFVLRCQHSIVTHTFYLILDSIWLENLLHITFWTKMLNMNALMKSSFVSISYARYEWYDKAWINCHKKVSNSEILAIVQGWKTVNVSPGFEKE
jgi:hypothetical protein